MTKKYVKKIMAITMALSMMLGTKGATPIFAASNVNGTINGVSCSGRIEYAKTPAGTVNGARAVTTFGPAGTITATATVYYKVGTKKYSKTSSNSSSMGGVSAVANTNDIGNVYGGKGTHKVVFGAYTWKPSSTTIGTTW